MKALGMNIARITIQQDAKDADIEIRVKSVKESVLFPQINNIYSIKYNDKFLPLVYTRIIRQHSVNDQVSVNYNYNTTQATMYRSSDKSTTQYPIVKNMRDVYSFLAKVISGSAGTGVYLIDVNGVCLQAEVIQHSSERVKTPIGEYTAIPYEITFHNSKSTKPPYVDMVTHNMLQDNNKLNLWVYNNQFPVKATFKKKAINCYCELISIKQ